jgi:hypothetical protein
VISTAALISPSDPAIRRPGSKESYFHRQRNPDRVILNGGWYQIASRVAQGQVIAPGMPTITTESGWESVPNPAAYPYVDYATQAKLTLDMIFDQFNAGVSSTYLYQLMDENELYQSSESVTRMGRFPNRLGGDSRWRTGDSSCAGRRFGRILTL